MAVERETIEEPRTVSVVKRILCDRCGRQLRRVAGVSMEREFEGTFVRGDLYPTQNRDDAERVEAELCASCTRELRSWIEAGTSAE